MADLLGVEIVIYHPSLPVDQPLRFEPEQGKITDGFDHPLYLRYNGVSHYNAYVPKREHVVIRRAQIELTELDDLATFILKQLVEGKHQDAKEMWEGWAPGIPWRAERPFSHVVDLCKRALKVWPLFGHAEYIRTLAYQHNNQFTHALMAAQTAWVLGVEARLEPRLHRTLAKAYFDLAQWKEALEAYEECEERGWLESEGHLLQECRLKLGEEAEEGRSTGMNEEWRDILRHEMDGALEDDVGSDAEEELRSAEVTREQSAGVPELVNLKSDDES
ncbi:hypothetical protein KFL_013240010, partial [Klebsormidium nitens]